MSDRRCRECGIDELPSGPDAIEIDGEVLCWADDDLCSRCQEGLRKALEQDAARYRFLRNRRTRPVDLAVGGVFAGYIGKNVGLSGEHLDRAIDAELGVVPLGEPLEDRLADCLAAAIDTPLLTLRDPDGNEGMELRLSSFNRAIASRAAELLEEAGR